MPPKLSVSVEELQKLRGIDKSSQSTGLIGILPQTPDDLQALQRTNHVVFQWKKVDDAEGYDLAISIDNNLNDPSFIIRLPGNNNLSYPFYTANASLTYNGWVRSYLGNEVSDFSSLQSARSLAGFRVRNSSTLASSTFDDTATKIAATTLQPLRAQDIFVTYSFALPAEGPHAIVILLRDTDGAKNDPSVAIDSLAATRVAFSWSYSYTAATSVGTNLEIWFTLRNATNTDTITVNDASITVINGPAIDSSIPETTTVPDPPIFKI